jgi:hypothetical protein
LEEEEEEEEEDEDIKDWRRKNWRSERSNTVRRREFARKGELNFQGMG